MRVGHEDARAHIARLNQKVGKQAIRYLGEPLGTRMALLFEPQLLEAANVQSDDALQNLLYTQAGILATPLQAMGILQDSYEVSINVVAPLTQRENCLLATTSEKHRKPIRAELFDRLTLLLFTLEQTLDT